MIHIILKNKIEQRKIDALLFFLKSWKIDAELITDTFTTKKKDKFSLSTGIWKDYDIDASDLRKQVWNRKQ